MNRIPSVVGNDIDVDPSTLTPDERAIASRLREMADHSTNWAEFANSWRKLVVGHCEATGLPRNRIPRSPLYAMGLALDSRVKLKFGIAQPSGYRDQLLELSGLYATRKQFCEAIGISEDMLSHVVHNRKDLSIASLQKALDRIGYTIKLVPVEGN